jgi:hypothetical protein
MPRRFPPQQLVAAVIIGGLAAIIIPDLVSRRFAMSGQPRHLRLASPVEGGILGLMGGATVLSSVKKGDLWRVQIAWPNGTAKYFGKFGTEQEASGWISRHRWLTEHCMEGANINRPWGSVSQRKPAVDVATEQAEGDA